MVVGSIDNSCVMTAKSKGATSVGKDDVNSRQFLNLPAMETPLISKEEAAQLLSRLVSHSHFKSNFSPMTLEVKKEKRDLSNYGVVDANTINLSSISFKNDLINSHANNKFQKIHKLYTVDEAWRTGKAIKSERKGGRGRSSRGTKEYNFVYPSLVCNCCC